MKHSSRFEDMERGVNWTHLAQKLDGSGALMSAVMNQRVPHNVGKLSASSGSICPQEGGFKNSNTVIET